MLNYFALVGGAVGVLFLLVSPAPAQAGEAGIGGQGCLLDLFAVFTALHLKHPSWQATILMPSLSTVRPTSATVARSSEATLKAAHEVFGEIAQAAKHA